MSKNNKNKSANRVHFKNSLKRTEMGKMEKILYFLAGVSGLINTGLWLIVDNNGDFPYEHPVIFWTGLSSLFAVLISGFVISCIREYKISPSLFMQTIKKILLILGCSALFSVLLFSFFMWRLTH